jgi:phage terminase large subunit-like protein
MNFKDEWLKFYDSLGETQSNGTFISWLTRRSKKKVTSDYTVMEVIGLAPDNNYYLIDGVRDRLNLTQRAQKLFELHRAYCAKSGRL